MKTTTFFQPSGVPLPGDLALQNSRQKEILVSVDFSDSSVQALREAASVAEREHARLTLLNVVEEQPSYRSPDYETRRNEIHREHEARLRELARRELRSGCEAQCVVSEGMPAREISRVAAQRHASLIVLGRHKPRRITHLFHRHTAEDVLRTAGCPVVMMG